MCRIYGHVGYASITDETLKRVADKQLNGGPDFQNYKLNLQGKWSLGNNRLAIQGINGGAQPYYSDGIYAVFNGEIYNHDTLRKNLISLGYVFDDNCDGSIIPAMYIEYGIDFVRKLDGMFSIAIIDEVNYEQAKLFILSDPIGIKSIYYSYVPNLNTLIFSSEIPPLLEFNICKNNIRPEAINEYFCGKAIWGDNTIYANIYQLSPSSILSFSVETLPNIRSYKTDISCKVDLPTVEETGQYLDSLLNYEVKRMLCADVPACVVTSGGLDSSYITAIASKYIPNIHSFNVAYEGEWPFDERQYALKISQQFSTNHHQIEIRKQDFLQLLIDMLSDLGQPNSAPHSLSTYALFKEVNKHGFKFALTGEGADEMFGGYKRFAAATYDNNHEWMESYLNKLSCISKSLRWTLYSEDYKKLLLNNDACYQHSVNTFNKLLQQHNKLDSLLVFDQDYRFPYYILRRVDHLSMANSVEVRVPFCQLKIQSFARHLKMDCKLDKIRVKKVLYEAAHGKIDESILNRPKQPFTLPITAMLQDGHPLMEISKEVIYSEKLKHRDIYNLSRLTSLLEEQLTSPNDVASEAIWSIMTLELWMQLNNIDFSVTKSFNLVNNGKNNINTCSSI